MRTKKIFSLMIFFILFLMINCINVNASIYIPFTTTNDPSSKYTNDVNVIDGDDITFAYTNTYTDDYWFEAKFLSGFNNAILCNNIDINVGWYKVGGGASAQKVDIELSYVEGTVYTGWVYNTFKIDQTYNFNTEYSLTIGKLVYLNGVRIRSDDTSNSYAFRIYNIEPTNYIPSESPYCVSTDFFNAKEHDDISIELCNNWINSSIDADIDFSDYVIPLTGDYLYITNSTTQTNYACNGSITLQKFYNLINCTGTLDSIYNYNSGWKVWANYTGIDTPIHLNDIEKNVTGSLSYSHNNTGYWVTSDHESQLDLIENLVNVTGTNTSFWDGNIWKIYFNYTGNETGYICDDFSDIIYINYSDENISFNATINYTFNGSKCNLSEITNLTNSSVNTDNWFYAMGTFILDNNQFFLLILITIWLFFVSKCLDDKQIRNYVMLGLMQFGLSIILAILISLIALSYPFGFVIVFLIPAFGLYLLAHCYYYRT